MALFFCCQNDIFGSVSNIMTKVFLVKTEPSCFSISDLKKERVTMWDGVHNYQAMNCISTWKIGEYVLIYHSMGEARIVGLGQVVSEPEFVLNAERKSCQAQVKFVTDLPENERQKLSLKNIKMSGLFEDFALVRQSRLSVMECSKIFVDWVKNQSPTLADYL